MLPVDGAIRLTLYRARPVMTQSSSQPFLWKYSLMALCEQLMDKRE